ncbi:MAG: hypothetical protein MKZ98_05600 [Pseudomonadales bacterium]|nr:hypothetical protein [Pseudomonadales bacterium]
MEEVNGKVAFVRVGASGIGLGMTRAFLKAGMQVAIGDLQSGRIDNAMSLLTTQCDADHVLPMTPWAHRPPRTVVRCALHFFKGCKRGRRHPETT